MVSRTTSRQAAILSVLTKDPKQDLYKISAHGTTCPLLLLSVRLPLGLRPGVPVKGILLGVGEILDFLNLLR